MKQVGLGALIMALAASWAGAQVTQQGEKLVGSGAVGNAGQGLSVALSADGNTAIVGGPGDDNGTGAAWVFVRSGGVWGQQGGKLVGTGALPGLYHSGAGQGVSVALSADGNTALVGGSRDNGETGAAWVFVRSGGVWAQQGGKLVAAGSVNRPEQGLSVALSADGDTALIGGPANNGWVSTGAAWVFTRSAGAWTQQGQKLVGTGAVGASGQGCSVALSGDGNTALVGGSSDTPDGAVWVFTRTGGVWSQQGPKLVGTGGVGAVGLGADVAISADGNTAIAVGSYDNREIGAAWVFTRSGGVWTQQGEKLVGTGATGGFNPWEGEMSVALSGDGRTAMLGRFLADGGAGAAWAFTVAGGVWTELGDKLVGSGAIGNAGQGGDVALSADGATAIVGGFSDNGHAGAAWVFTSRPAALWVPVVVNAPGLNWSHWQSDLGLLNAGSVAANVQLTFHGADGIVTNTGYVPAGAQSVLVDVVGQLGASGQGALEISSDQPLKITSRTYNRASAEEAGGAYGTVGQSYPTLTAGEGLSEGQTAWLPHLVENAAYRTNIGLVNSSAASAEVTVELYDGAGGLLTSYAVGLAPGAWKQETQPFNGRAGQAAVDRGYAKVKVRSGSGVSVFASVIDNVTNDPTTIAMQR